MRVGIFRLSLYLLLVFFSISYVSAYLNINEVMYNPEGSDNNKEFVEIYSDEEVNLSEYVIGDSSSNDSLSLLQYYDSDYYLIVEEGFNFSGIEVSVYSAGVTIGNNLNTDDFLFLYYNGSLVYNMSYVDDCLEGYSLEYFDGGYYCSFYLGGTPGRGNSYGLWDYSNVVINEFLSNPFGDDNSPMPGGEFIEVYNNGENDTDLGGVYFMDLAGHKLYITDTRTLSGTLVESEEYLAIYMNGFSGFLNNEGFEKIRLYDYFGNLIDEVSYGSSEEGLSWALIGGVWRYGFPSPNDKNPNKDVEMVSSFDIVGLEDLGTDNESKFGDTIKVNFNVYKGNTSKSSIKFYVENDEDRVSKIVKASLPDKYTHYSLTLPIFIEPNCNQKYFDGDYYVKVGWTSSSEAEDTFRFRIEGINENNCDKMYVERSPRKGTLDQNLLEAPGTVEPDKDFMIMVELINNDGMDHLVDLYSYVYRGRTTYSGEQELNKKSVLVKSGETKEVGLSNVVNSIDPGEYNLKVKVKRDDQKTEKEITQTINVLSGGSSSLEEDIVLEGEVVEDSGEEMLLEIAEEGVIYESTSVKANNLVVPFFIALLVVYSCVLTWKKIN